MICQVCRQTLTSLNNFFRRTCTLHVSQLNNVKESSKKDTKKNSSENTNYNYKGAVNVSTNW